MAIPKCTPQLSEEFVSGFVAERIDREYLFELIENQDALIPTFAQPRKPIMEIIRQIQVD
jgi:hypothetical protein